MRGGCLFTNLSWWHFIFCCDWLAYGVLLRSWLITKVLVKCGKQELRDLCQFVE